jgi:uncharacterized cupin superfamily protein
VLGQAAHIAKRHPEFAAACQGIAARRGKKIATTAVARKLLTRASTHACRYCVLDRSEAGILSAVISERSALMAEEPTPGAGVTTWLVADQVWEHDEETGGQVAMLVDSPNVQAGLWRPGLSGLGPIEVELQHTEIILVLSGTGQLEVDGGAPLELTPGRAARIDVGAHTRWMVDQEFTELWLYV